MLSLSTRCVLAVEPRGESRTVSKLAFHPSRAVIATAVGDCVTVDDFNLGEPVQRGVVQLRSTVQQVVLSESFLAASDEAGSIYVWNFFNLHLVTDLCHTQQEEKPLGKIYLAPSLPILMYTRANSKALYVQEIGTLNNMKPATRLDCKRTISGVCIHPSETMAAMYCNGVVVVYDYVSGAQLCQSDELLRGNQSAAGKGMLSFGANGKHLAVASEKGMLACFNFEQQQLTRVGLSKATSKDSVVGIRFHPVYPVFFVLSAGGLLVPWSISCEVAKTCAVELVTEMEHVARAPELSRLNNTSPSPLVVSGFKIHPSLGVFAFTFASESHIFSKALLSRHILYSLVDRNEPNFGTAFALAGVPSRQETLAKFVGDDKQFQASLFFVEGGSILKQGLHTGATSAFGSLPTVTAAGVPLHPLEVMLTETGILTRFQTVEPLDSADDNCFDRTVKGYYALVDYRAEAAVPVILPGASIAARFGAKESQSPFLLAQDRLSAGVAGGAMEKLPSAGRAIFTAPPSGSAERLLVWVEGALVLTDLSFKDFSSARLRLQPWESVCSAAWNLVHVGVNEHNYVCAIMTTHRIVIVDESMCIVAQVCAQTQHPFIRNFSSIFWIGACLLYSTVAAVSALTLSGDVFSLCEVSAPESAIVGVWCDRLLLAYNDKTKLRVRTRAVGLLEPLLLGELAACDKFGRARTLNREHVSKLLARFDSRRVSKALLSRLELGGYYDVALALSKESPFVSLERKFYQALYSKHFELAKSFLDKLRADEVAPPVEEPATGMDMLKAQAAAASLPASPALAKLYRALGTAAAKYGQFALAVACFTAADAYVDMLPILASTANADAVEDVLKQLRDKPNCTDISATCKRLLKSKALVSSGTGLPTFHFTRAHAPLTTTPTTVACMSSSKASVPNLEFQDSIERWFSVIVDSHAEHAFEHRETDFEVTEENQGIPSNLRNIVPLLITRLEAAQASLDETNFLKERPRSLAPPPAKRMLVRREGYSLASSSLLRGSSRDSPSAEATDVTTVTYNSDDESADMEQSPQVSKAKIVAPNRASAGLPGDSDVIDVDLESSDSAEFLSDDEVLDGPPPMEELSRSPSMGVALGEAGASEGEEEEDAVESDSDQEFVSEEILSEGEEVMPSIVTPDNQGEDAEDGVAGESSAEETTQVDKAGGPAVMKRTTSSGLIPPKQHRRPALQASAPPPAPAEGADGDPLLEPPCDDEFTRQRSPSDDSSQRPQLMVAASTPALVSSSLPPRPPRNKSASNLSSAGESEGTLKSPRAKSPRSRQWTNVRSSVSSVSHINSGGSARSLVTRAHNALRKSIESMVIGRFSTAQVRAEQAAAILASANAANFRSEAKLCAAYRQSARILQRLKLLDYAGSGAECHIAFLCSVLASLPVAPVHRLAFTCIAAEKNFLAQNYGVASVFLKVLQMRNLLNKAQVDQMIADCELLGCSDVQEFQPSSVRCCITFEEIRGPHVYCAFCNSSYCLESGRAGDTCWLCNAGSLAVRSAPSRSWGSK